MSKMTDAWVRKVIQPGMHADGGGLYLSVTPTKRDAHPSKSWVVRYSAPDGRRRSMGLGSYPEVTLAAARREAFAKRAASRGGVDPLQVKREARRAAAVAAARQVTFKECATRYMEAHAPSWRNDKHVAQWGSTLATYVYPVFGDLPVCDVDTPLVMRVLDPIWRTKNETASRVRGRIETVLDWAKARSHRDGENPARWKGHLQHALPARSKIAKVEHHAALPFDEIGPFMRQLREMPGIAARALDFTILTAARTGEVIGATWSELDLDAKVWTVPASRMKAGRDHRVPLSPAAMTILIKQRAEAHSDYVFSAGDTPMSNMALLMTLRRMKRADLTVHGFRSTFRDWAAERTNYPREVAEAALAHAVGDKVEAAYRRGDLFEKRRVLMTEWADYCDDAGARADGNVLVLSRMVG